VTAQAPVAVFAYRRADHLRRTLRSLRSCAGFDGTPLYLFSDGPKGPSEASDVDRVREVAYTELGSQAEYHLSPVNRGLSGSVITGVRTVLERHETVVVVEDDLELSSSFLAYMSAALERYSGERRVMQVSGHAFQVPELSKRQSALFLPFTTSWGWGTWRRAWEQLDTESVGWRRLAEDAELRRRFNLGDTYDYATMLERQMSGVGDSWAIRWYWTVFLATGLVLFPPSSLVRNIGMDGTGTHGRGILRRLRPSPADLQVGMLTMPDAVRVDEDDFAAVCSAMRRHNAGTVGALADHARRLILAAVRRGRGTC
jgi:hypothetical protein